MLRLLLLGKNGQLGYELHRALGPLGQVQALDYPDIDLTRPDSIRSLVKDSRPDLIVNATAYTAVDQAESQAEIAHAINAEAPGCLAEEAARLGAGLIHYSTDYVFDGSKGSLYTEQDAPHPLNVYGESKLAGEQAIASAGGSYLILRTSWVYSLRRDSFVTKVLQWARQNPTLKIVSDQVGNPTWARLLAEISAQLLAKAGANPAVSPAAWLEERRGIYHLAGSGYASRLEWAQEILTLARQSGAPAAEQVLPARTADFPTPANRPLFSALDCSRFSEVFGLRLPDWQAALKLAMESQ